MGDLTGVSGRERRWPGGLDVCWMVPEALALRPSEYSSPAVKCVAVREDN